MNNLWCTNYSSVRTNARFTVPLSLKIFLSFCKCSKILNTFLILISNKMLVIRVGIHKMLVRIANREDTDQTASQEAV